MVSIIIPVYNAYENLHKCIESLLHQSYEDFEIILINDGSTDSSGEICDQYALQEKKIKVFHKKNEGVSATRNFGIEKSNFDFIVFVDADDIVSKNYLLDLIIPISDDLDLIISAVNQLRDNQNDVRIVRSLGDTIKKDDFHNLFETLQIANFGYVVGILYRKSIITENNIQFDTRLAQSEDMLFILDYILHLKNDINCVPSANYQYIMDVPNSGSKKKVSAESINLQLSSIYEMIAKRYSINDFKAFPVLAQLLDYIYYKKLSELVNKELNWDTKITNLKKLDKGMIRFFQNIRKKSLRAGLLDFLLLNGHYKLFLKLRNL